VLVAANALLGAGFGGSMTALNSYAPRLAPARPQSALTAMHAIVGLGTVLPPVALPRLFALGIWWTFPLALAAAIALVASLAALLPLDRLAAPAPAAGATRRATASSLWLFCAVAALYGLLEALFGDWGGVFLHEERMLEAAAAGLAVSFFWGAVTVGRVTVAVAAQRVSPRAIHIALPLAIAAALVVARGVSGPVDGALVLALGGLGCSSFLPLTIGAAAAANPSRSETAAGLSFAAYLAGNGIGGSGVGLVRDLVAVPIGAMYLVGAALAVTLAWLAAQSLSARRQLG
jgi:fucose permease